MNAPLPAPLTIAEHDGSAVLTLNRPDARNPLSEATLHALTEALDRAEAGEATAQDWKLIRRQLGL